MEDFHLQAVDHARHTGQRLAFCAPCPRGRRTWARAAFAALAGDQEFLADAEKSNLDVAPLPGEAVDKVVALIAAAPADVADRFAKIFAAPGQSR